MFTEQIIPFYENVKQLVQNLNENIVTEVTEYMRIFDELDTEYERCVLANKNLNIKRKNLLIQNDCLIANSLEKDICSIVLASDIAVPPSSNCLCKELRSNCDREHSKVVELEAEILKKQQMLNESEKRFKGSASRERRHHQKLANSDQHYENVESRIQNDGFKAENVNLKRRYKELSKSNAYSRSTFTAKINALTAENAKLKTELSDKKTSGSTASEKPKVLASGMYTNSSKYIPPPKRANWVKPTLLPKKKQVTFQEPPRTSNRPTQKPRVQQNKKPNVSVNLSTRTKPATESRKPMPKSQTQNHRILPSKSVNARRAADHNRRNHNVNTTKTAWRPTGKVVGSVKPQWKPTGRHFALYDNCPLTRIMEPIVEPLELTPSVSSSSKVTMISRFTDCKLSDRKAGSKGISGQLGRNVADSIAERLKRPTAYKFRQIAVSLLSRPSTRTASIRKSDTSVLEDLKALSWKTCQEEQTATGKEISNPFLADSLLKTIRHMLTLQDLKKSRKLSLQSFRTSESMSSSNVKVMKSRRRKITKAFRITTNMSMSDHSLANGKMKKRSHIIQEIRDQDQVIKTSNSSSKDQDQVIKTSNSSSIDQELVEGKEKRAGTELIQENTKKQKVEDDKETTELKQLMKIIPYEEEVAINALPLAVKSPSIVGWKIYKEGRKSYFQIMRADGKSQMYMFFSQMLKKFDREDLEDLYKLVKAKFESIKPVEDLDLLLWGDLKTMFKSHVEDAIYMLVEKKYPLAPLTLLMMLEKKLNIDYESEMAYQLLKLIIKQLKNLLDAVRITVAQVYVNTALMKSSGAQGNGRDDGPGGQVGGQGSEVNGGVDRGPGFSTIIAQRLQNLLPTIVAQVGDQGRGQGNGRNQNGDAINDNI
ncbi:hypothetical protein Tco_0913220 [Tanacetum coccineum]